ncbi:MAG: cell division protein FtsZ [Deltaproteobacteria bacterium]|nr:cell division protein FtsZ [Deltaproteobacteria bacterium]
MFEATEDVIHSASIKVIGVGGGGNNAVEAMITSNMPNVDFIIANTDSKSLRASQAKTRIQLGSKLTKGLGSGTRPDIGREAALESRSQLVELLQGVDLLFIAAGMGGGTGTGAAPIIAEAAREAGILTVGIVTKPFIYEGKVKTGIAEKGIKELKKYVDSLIVISNDRLISQASKGMSLFDAFKPADDVLRQAVQGISELIMSTGYMNLDFADVRTVMSIRGMAMMGLGTGTGEERASVAINMAISSPMLEDNDISGAIGVLVNITGSSSMTIDDYTTVNRIVSERVHENATIKIGVVQDESIGDEIKVTVIATGFSGSFDNDSGNKLTRRSGPLNEKHPRGKHNLDIPTFQRDRLQDDKNSRLRPTDASEIIDKDVFHIPTFLRKQVD